MRARALALWCTAALVALGVAAAFLLARPRGEVQAAEPVQAIGALSFDSALSAPTDGGAGRTEPGVSDGPIAERLEPDERAQLAPASEQQIALWIDALRDDDVPHNADEAFDGLRRAGSAAVPALEAALGSRDEQQRFLAARILARLEPGEQWYRAGSELLATWDRRAIVRADCEHEWAIADWIAPNAPAFARALEARLDGPLRTEAAFAIVRGGASRSRREALEHLIGCLADNYRTFDAFLSVEALLEAPDVLGAVSAAWPGIDAQQRRLLEHLIARRAPADPRGKLLSEDELRALGFCGRWSGARKPVDSRGVTKAGEWNDTPETDDGSDGTDAFAAPPEPWWVQEDL